MIKKYGKKFIKRYDEIKLTKIKLKEEKEV